MTAAPPAGRAVAWAAAAAATAAAQRVPNAGDLAPVVICAAGCALRRAASASAPPPLRPRAFLRRRLGPLAATSVCPPPTDLRRRLDGVGCGVLTCVVARAMPLCVVACVSRVAVRVCPAEMKTNLRYKTGGATHAHGDQFGIYSSADRGRGARPPAWARAARGTPRNTRETEAGLVQEQNYVTSPWPAGPYLISKLVYRYLYPRSVIFFPPHSCRWRCRVLT